MYLLYLDESGNERDPQDRHFVLAGMAVSEYQAYYLSSALDTIQAKHLPGHEPVPFHATDIRNGKKFWRRQDKTVRTAVLHDIAAAIRQVPPEQLVLFGSVIAKSGTFYGEAAVRHAAAQVCQRFDTFLKRRYHEHSDRQRGLLVFAQGNFHDRARLWISDFRELGTKWGAINNLADIPYFAKADETRLLQVADFVAHALFLLYERRDPSLAASILPRMDQKDGKLHGLYHEVIDKPRCECPACFSRRSPGSLGPWVSSTPAAHQAAR